MNSHLVADRFSTFLLLPLFCRMADTGDDGDERRRRGKAPRIDAGEGSGSQGSATQSWGGRPRQSSSRTASSGSSSRGQSLAVPTEEEVEEEADASVDPRTGYGMASVRDRRRDVSFTDAELDIPDVPPLHDLAYHPIIYLRYSQRPPTTHSSFRGASLSALRAMQAAAPSYRDFLTRIGFGAFMTLQTDRLDHRLVTGLLERWFRETRTLHLVGFELGPTPVDWMMITGIFFGGHPIVLRAVTAAEARLGSF